MQKELRPEPWGRQRKILKIIQEKERKKKKKFQELFLKRLTMIGSNNIKYLSCLSIFTISFRI